MPNTQVNRTVPPTIRAIDQVALPTIESLTLDNGLRVKLLNSGTQDVMKLELVVQAGRPFEQKRLASRTTIGLLKEGTTKRSSADLAELLDFYGASLSSPFSLDTGHLVLYSLTKHSEKLLPLFTEILTMPAFPEKELKAFVQRNQQRLKVDLSKEDIVAYRAISAYIFGSETPYGYNSTADMYAAIAREDILAHYQRNYLTDSSLLLVSGRVSDHFLRLMNQTLGQINLTSSPKMRGMTISNAPPESLHLPHEEGLQSAIRIGKRLFSRQHPDYPGMFVLNTILGGYFGSRLMANIREDKGYTYNIYSSLDPLKYDGYFYVGTEVGNAFVQPTIKEIYQEMNVLQQDLVDDEELDMVKNYLLGTFLMNLDGPFNAMDVYKSLVYNDLPSDYFEQLVDTVRYISAEKLRDLAQRHFQRESLWQVVVGSVADEVK
ncbi:MAG: pitrilysin family protein [Bacteroidota bacterium]